jgi:hypothetical protein
MTTQLETPATLPPLEPLLKTSGKRTASVFCAELGDADEEKRLVLFLMYLLSAARTVCKPEQQAPSYRQLLTFGSVLARG